MPDSRIMEYVGVPFLLGGRDTKGCDCWGLARLVLDKVYGKHLPSYDVVEDLDPVEIASLVDTFVPLLPLSRVESPGEGDIVLMKYMGYCSHIGLAVGDGYVLHSDPLCRDLSKLDRMTSPRIAARMEGFYRVQ